MFERNRVDSGVMQVVTLPAEIELDNGAVLAGKFITNAARTFLEILNSPSQFLEFEPYGEERMFLAKSSIRSMRLVQVPGPQGLDQKQRETGGFDPFAVLGLAKPTSWDEVRQAYVRLSKSYHPDRFNTVELPDEVRSYLEATARRINVAYAALEKTHIADKARANGRSEPVFTSAPRA